MDNSNRYRKEQDLIFQQMEELERLESQALAAAQEALRDVELGDRYKFIIRLCKTKAFQDLMRFVPAVEDREKIVRSCIQAWEENRDTPGTHS